MSVDPEMDLWRQGWKSSERLIRDNADALRAEAIRQELRQRRRLAQELSVGVFFLPASFAVAYVYRSSEMILWAAVVWALTIAVSAYMVWNYRTLWNDSAKSVHDFMALARQRAHATLRAVSFGYWFIGVSIVIDVAWYTIDLALHRMDLPRYCLGLGLIALISLAIAKMLSHRRAEALRDLEQIGPASD